MKVSSSMSSLAPLGVPGWRGKVLPLAVGPHPADGLGSPEGRTRPGTALVLVAPIPVVHSIGSLMHVSLPQLCHTLCRVTLVLVS